MAPDSAAIPKAVAFQIEAARRLGLEARVLDPAYGFLFELRDGRRRRLMVGGRSPLNDSVAARVAGDKYYTKVVLGAIGLRVPAATRCLAPGYFGSPRLAARAGVEPGLAFAAARAYPLIVKPNRKSHGREVAEVGADDELVAAVRRVWKIDYIALVEERATGIDLRLDFLDGEYLIGYRRQPLAVTGDGRAALRELLAAADPRTASDDFWGDVETDPVWRERVLAAGLGPGSVLAAGRELRLGGTVLNLHRWAVARYLAEAPPGLAELGRTIGSALGLRFYGVDLKAPALDARPEEATVLEVNASPLLTGIAELGYREQALAAQMKVLEAAMATAAP